MSLRAQHVFEGLAYVYETQISVSNSKTPLWLNANKYGLSSLDRSNGYVRAAIGRDVHLDDARKVGVGYGLDIALPYNYDVKVAIQQLYAEFRYKRLSFTLGSKYQPLELKNQSLSSGSQALGVNARPVPQFRISVADYYTLPYTRQWLAVKGHLSYGYMTDGDWQRDFTSQSDKWAEGTLYHSKAGFLRIRKPSSSFTIELGLEMATLFGGTINIYDNTTQQMQQFQGGHRLVDFWHAFTPGGNDFVEKEEGYVNAEGDVLGSWLARFTYDHRDFEIALYADHFFEDHSSCYNLGYYGYGKDGDWQKRSKKLYLYPLKDGMLGVELKLKRQDYLKCMVLEFINTRYQSGPIYHDHTQNIYDQIGGQDNYYNHKFYSGWSYYGQVIGNPLYLSPIYNDGEIDIQNNRFFAWHFGLQGSLSANLNYRLLATWQKGLGTYRKPYPTTRENFSCLAEVGYALTRLCGWSVKAGFGFDQGKLLGNNNGFQLSVTYKR